MVLIIPWNPCCSMQVFKRKVAYHDLMRCLAGCPLCMREVNMLKRRDEGKGKIYFVDIDAPDYRPEDNAGITYEQVQREVGFVAGCLVFFSPGVSTVRLQAKS